MARDVVRLAAEPGHDRGVPVAFRAAMDHPRAVSRALFLDVLATLDMWDALRGVTGAVGFHLYHGHGPGLRRGEAGRGLQVGEAARTVLDSGTSITVKDALPDDRWVLVESNWKVCAQTRSAGASLSGQPVEFTAVKSEETCP